MRITFTGDILCYASQIQAAKVGNREYDFSQVFEHVRPYLDNSDYVCGSLETPVADFAYTSSDINFNTPYEFLRDLSDTGFDMLTTGNNHCLDRGIIGLKNTIHALDYFKLDHTGTYISKEASEEIFIKRVGGLRVAFLSFTYGTNSKSNKQYLPCESEYMVDLLRKQDRVHIKKRSILERVIIRSKRLLVNNKPITQRGPVVDSVSDNEIDNPENRVYLDRFISKVKKAKEQSDVVVLCLHSGGQFNFDLGIGNYTKYIVETAIANGVDILVGNHTHCIMPAKWAKENTFLAYALGNFSFTPGEGYYVKGVYADYSILLHIDFNPLDIKSYTVAFSVLKSVKTDDGGAAVYNVFDLYSQEHSPEIKKILVRDTAKVVSKFTGVQCAEIEIRKEYNF